MSQPTNYTVGNVTAPAFRSNMNSVLEGLVTLSSNPSEPADRYANMLWYDTSANILKMRSENDDAWINVGYLCQSTNKFCILDDTNVVDSSGTQTGLIGDQATSAWQAGTSTTESLVSPAKIKAAANFTDFAEGAAGQPRIFGLAAATSDEMPILTVAAADTYDIGFAADVTGYTGATTSTSFVTLAIIEILAVTGSARFSASHRLSGDAATVLLELFRNSVLIGAWTTGSTTNQVRTVDSAVAVGDVFTWRHRRIGGNVASSVATYNGTFATDGYATAPLLIKASDL